MRLIDADALYKDICDSLNEMTRIGIAVDGEWLWGKLNDSLENVPTIEPEPQIVRCKDCEYGEQDEYGRWYCRGFGCQVGDEDGSGFCSDAERKNNV